MATTPNRGYQLPAASSKLKDDVLRLIAALVAIDTDVAGLLTALAGKADLGHGHAMAEITGLVAALGNKLDVGYHDALANLTDVDVAGVANGMALLRQAGKWIPVALQINNIAGLETALNGKATPADITAAINSLVAAAPGALDTLNELATALGNDPDFATTITTALAGKLAKDGSNVGDATAKTAFLAAVRAADADLTLRKDGSNVGDMAAQAALLNSLGGAVAGDLDQTGKSSTWKQQVRKNLGLEFGYPLIHAQDQRASGVLPGSNVSGYQQRVINTVVLNEIAGASLTSNLISLPEGTYQIEAMCQAYRTGQHKLLLRDAANNPLLVGLSEYANSSTDVGNAARVSGRVSIGPGGLAVQLTHYTGAVNSGGNGLGVASASGNVEVYADFKAWKLK